MRSEAQWRERLAFTDRTQMTLYLRGKPGLPEWLAGEIEARYEKNRERRARLRHALAEVCQAFAAEQIEFVLLKGFTHVAGFGLDGGLRVQYDLDVLTDPGDMQRARAALARLGYAAHGSRSLSAEHALPMVRPSNWTWKRDYYDPSMPIPVELHGSPWSPERDRIDASGVNQFWARRTAVQAEGLSVPAFAREDALGFASLHVLRHILRQDVRPAHVLELARMLDACASDAAFWERWSILHPAGLRTLETAGFRFAQQWFGCAWPEAVERDWLRQPAQIHAWFDRWAWSPLENLLRPNKAAVWLHLALLERRRDRAMVFFDRMLPLRLPHREESGPYGERLLARLRYHAAALAPALASGLRWRRQASSTASQTSDWKRRSV